MAVMAWSERHPVLATLRDLFGIPLAATIGLVILGELVWLLFGGTSASYSISAGYCGSGASLQGLLTLAAWIGAIAGSVRFTRSRGSAARIGLHSGPPY
jgi:hypothetical protein